MERDLARPKTDSGPLGLHPSPAELLGCTADEVKIIQCAFKGERVVMIDDSARQIERYQAALKSVTAGDAFALRFSGESLDITVARIKDLAPTIVLVDWQLLAQPDRSRSHIVEFEPGDLNGLDLTKRLRELLPHAKLIGFSSSIATELVLDFFGAGANFCLNKDLEPRRTILEMAQGLILDRHADEFSEYMRSETAEHNLAVLAQNFARLKADSS